MVVVAVVVVTDLSIPRGLKWEYVYVYFKFWKSLKRPYDDIFVTSTPGDISNPLPANR